MTNITGINKVIQYPINIRNCFCDLGDSFDNVNANFGKLSGSCLARENTFNNFHSFTDKVNSALMKVGEFLSRPVGSSCENLWGFNNPSNKFSMFWITKDCIFKTFCRSSSKTWEIVCSEKLHQSVTITCNFLTVSFIFW